jgi:hypothetical protein
MYVASAGMHYRMAGMPMDAAMKVGMVLVLAGLVALLARSRRGLLLIGSWFVVYLLAKGTYIPASIDDASFWRILMPSFPAYAILVAAVVLLVPGVRIPPADAEQRVTRRRLTIVTAAAFAVFAVLPLGVLAAVPRLHDQGALALRTPDTLIPVSRSLGLRATASGAGVRLTWNESRPATAGGFYHVLRTKRSSDVGCAGRVNGSADNCVLYGLSIATTRAKTFTDRPGAGTWTYRVAVAANWLDDPKLGDLYVLSTPLTLNVG